MKYDHEVEDFQRKLDQLAIQHKQMLMWTLAENLRQKLAETEAPQQQKRPSFAVACKWLAKYFVRHLEATAQAAPLPGEDDVVIIDTTFTVLEPKTTSQPARKQEGIQWVS